MFSNWFGCIVVISFISNNYVGEIGHLGCLPYTWKTQKFQLENQMVRIIPFGVLLKLWAPGQSDAFLLLSFGIYN